VKRLTPTTDLDSIGRKYVYMEPDPSGGYVSVDDVYHWLRGQRNDVPMTGEEAAAGFLDALRGENERLRAENEALKGAIPAYEPPPCKCCREWYREGYAAECDCENLVNHEAAVRWCVRTEIADKFDDALRGEEEK